MKKQQQENLWRLLVKIAEEALEKDNISQAEFAYRRAIDMATSDLGANHGQVAELSIYLAELYMLINKFEEAEKLYENARRIYVDRYGEEHMLVAMALRNIAEARESRGYADEARSIRCQAQRIFG